MADEFVTFEIKGVDELQHKLEELPEKVGKRGIKKALRAGANVLRSAMMLLAPKRSGFLASHFGSKLRIKRDFLAGNAYVGPQGKMDYPEFASGAYKIKRGKNGKIRQVGRIAVASVARFLEFGTSKMAKKPFMTQAAESYKEEITEAMIDELRKAVEET